MEKLRSLDSLTTVSKLFRDARFEEWNVEARYTPIRYTPIRSENFLQKPWVQTFLPSSHPP